MVREKKFKWLAIMVAIITMICIQTYYPDYVKAEEQSSLGYGEVPDGTVTETTETTTTTSQYLVTPCRILDTRIVGGYFVPGESREYYVYGLTDVSSQGGNPLGCYGTGEPKGVIINVTAVPVSGGGYFTVYPANVSPPNASIVNYLAGHGPIANAATVESYYLVGPREIEFYNGYGYAHLVVDVMGYLY